jgi:hypothetical protein
MANRDRPDSETLLLWVSAFFDGELTESEEEQLFAAMQDDPKLEAEFHKMQALLGGDDAMPGLTDAIMGAVAPEAVSETPAGAALLASALSDDELDEAGESHLADVVRDESAAAETLAFLHASEGVHVALSGSAETAAAREATAKVPDQVSAYVAASERAAELYSALCDDELGAGETAELDSLVAQGAALPAALPSIGEAVNAVLLAPAEDPMAARAGAAALQVIEAQAAQQTDAALATHGGGDSTPLLERWRRAFSQMVAPLAAAGAAAALFFMVGDPDKAKPTTVPSEDDWLAVVAEQNPDLFAQAPTEDLEVLGDNSGSEVQAIDSGSHLAAVFTTEASSITVIWVPEPDPTAFDDGAESGT